MKIPRGQENELPKYAPERRIIWERRVNPCVPVRCCVVCKKPIIWTYRNGELWSAPRFACENDKCQRIFQYKASWPEELHVNRPGFAGY
jgi:hypothetical protein